MVAAGTSRLAHGVLLIRDRTGLGGRCYHQTVESTSSSSSIGFV